jgi:UDP-2,3-diacylglucosamine pyrophosphatase LpxH
MSDNTIGRIHKTIPTDREIFFISDLHLGDGTSSDSFQGKDDALIEFLEHVRKCEAHLVIVGDAIDFHQAWTFSRVLKAHGKLFGVLSSLADTHGVTYIWGNHDADMSFFKDILRFHVCSSLSIGDLGLVVHGYEYDPFIGPNLEATHQATRIHHLIERALGSWIRTPLEHFYTWPNRIVFWIVHKLAILKNQLPKIGLTSLSENLTKHELYWVHAQLGDPQGIFEQVRTAVTEGPHQFIVTGHSHMPGKVEIAPGRFYINTGSWTFRSATYAHWDGTQFRVRDWVRNKDYTDHLYQPLLDRRWRHMDMMAWWRANYLGWFRFRAGETRRAPSLRPATHTVVEPNND